MKTLTYYSVMTTLILIIMVFFTINIENLHNEEIEELETEVSMLESNLNYYKKEATEMELYFEYLNDIDRLNKEIFEEGFYIDIDGEFHTYEIKTTEVVFEVDYIQFYEDIIDYIELLERYNDNDFIISFEQFLKLESPGLIERIETYDDIYYDLREANNE